MALRCDLGAPGGRARAETQLGWVLFVPRRLGALFRGSKLERVEFPAFDGREGYFAGRRRCGRGRWA